MYIYTCTYNWVEGSEFACAIRKKTKTWPVGALKLDDICEGGPDPMSTLAIGSNRPSKSECSDTGSAARG